MGVRQHKKFIPHGITWRESEHDHDTNRDQDVLKASLSPGDIPDSAFNRNWIIDSSRSAHPHPAREIVDPHKHLALF